MLDAELQIQKMTDIAEQVDQALARFHMLNAFIVAYPIRELI